MRSNRIVPSESSESELEDPGLYQNPPDSPQPGPSWASSSTSPPRKRKRTQSKRSKKTPKTRDQDTSTTNLVSPRLVVDNYTQTYPNPGADSGAETDVEDNIDPISDSPLEGAVLTVAEDTDAAPSHPPDCLEVQPIPGPSNWIPPGILEGNTMAEQEGWTWDPNPTRVNLPRTIRTPTRASLAAILGQAESPLQGTPELDEFVNNWSDEASVTSNITNTSYTYQPISDSGSTEDNCDSDCSCHKENWAPAPRPLTPTPPHSPVDETSTEEDTFDMQLHLESD